MKIYIVGIVAAGKTTFAKELSEHMGIPFHELDTVVYVQTHSVKRKRSPEEQLQVIREIDRGGDWIIEGTYRESCRCLFDLADRIIFLDPPLRKRLFRIFKRYLKQKLKIEPCHYRSDLHMLRCMYRWTFDFERNRPDFTAMLNNYHEKLVTVADPREFQLD